MKHEEKQINEVIITESKDNFETWINRSYISNHLKENLGKANILIVPIESFRDKNIPMFSTQAEELFHYLKENLPDSCIIDMCIEDDDYKELTLHFDLITIGTFVVKKVVAPILLSRIQDYLKNKVFPGDKKGNIKISLTVIDEKEKVAKNISYEGNIDNFGKLINYFSKKEISND
jgi:hypothetical protein